MQRSRCTSVASFITMMVASVIAVGVLAEPACGQSRKSRQLGRTNQGSLSLDDVFPTDRLLDVRITLPEEDWDTLRNQSRGFREALHEKRREGPLERPYSYVEARLSIDGVEFPRIGIRKKGFIGSQSRSRPSLKIKLNHVDKQGGIEGLTRLTFNNNKQDASQLSQFMGYAFFNAAGSPASRCAFARVTVNDVYLGIYSHVESLRRPFIKREFGSDEGTLYEGTVVDFVEGWDRSFEHKFGDEASGQAKIERLISVIEGDEGKVTERRIGEVVDLKAFYHFWAVECLLGFWDGYSGNRNNFWFYLNPKTDRLHFIPWGADALFQKKSPLGDPRGAPVSVRTMGVIAHKLYQLRSGRERYAKALKNVLRKYWKEKALLAEVDRLEAMLEPHLARRQRGFQRSLERVRQFIRSRRKEILKEISGGMPIWTRVPERPPAIPGEIKGSPAYEAIWNAARKGDVKGIEKQLARGTDVNIRADRGTPLGIAALAGRTEAVRYLIEKGADLNARGEDGSTPLHGAAFLGHLAVVEELIKHKANLNARNRKRATPLDNASTPWTEEIEGIVFWLADYIKRDLQPQQVKAARPKVADLLRRRGAKLSKELGARGGTDIWTAAKNGDLRALARHLEQGTDLNARDDGGITPLSWASMAGHRKVVAVLLDEGAKIDSRNRDGATSLHSAAFLGHQDIVELLLKNKANVNAKNREGETPLGSVAGAWGPEIKGITEFIVNILSLKADIDAIRVARPKIARLLRKHGGKTGDELK